ncbi:putative ABC transporter ATP-binding protein TDE_0282 [uncultured Eubacteriales bacterium]|uniref:Putative ABC transporter ATP-binding protein TDE_0282 n=1 Tax=uncultured Eubacteriales bacterium TaxID=172733 RepID=A0A212JDR2_9FIRM|nr:putative ABC transporter ATP-binding protein TDE_0282 [uncultured Eubacteriales bacterium]
MIEINHVSFGYANSETETLKDVSLRIGRGECVLLCGESGCGKTTVTRLINGLIPHYYEGELSGGITVGGLDVSESELYETARVVGSVFQNPRSQFFCVDTTSEIAFGCENMGLPVEKIKTRIGKAAQELGILNLLGRNIFNLSGGEKQKVACASISAMQPEVFVLDEPTSNLDIDAIEELKKTLLHWKGQGKTIVIAEHRLSWLRDVCDRAIYMREGQIELDIPMGELRAFPSKRISELGLRSLSSEPTAPTMQPYYEKSTLELVNYRFSYGEAPALNIPSLSLPVGGMVAVIGHNGAGKSTLSKCLCGIEKRFRGRAVFHGAEYGRKQMLKKSYMVMQDVNHQLFCETVEDEVRLGMSEDNQSDVRVVLDELDLGAFSPRHPMSLSGGQKQRVAIASAILANKELLIFDEPTSGLDFRRMEQTAELLSSLRGRKTALIITHDPELIMRCCTHVLHLERGAVAAFYPLTQENLPSFYAFFSPQNSDRMEPKPV